MLFPAIHFRVLFAIFTALWGSAPSFAASAGNLSSSIKALVPPGTTLSMVSREEPRLTPSLLLDIELTTVRTMSRLAKSSYRSTLPDTMFRSPSQSRVQIQSLAPEGREEGYEVRHAMWALNNCYELELYLRYSLEIMCSFYLPQAQQIPLPVGSLLYKNANSMNNEIGNTSFSSGPGGLAAVESQKRTLVSGTEPEREGKPDLPSAIYADVNDIKFDPLDNTTAASRQVLNQSRGGIRLFNFGTELSERAVFATSWGAIMDRAAKNPRRERFGAYSTHPLRGMGVGDPEIEYHPLPGGEMLAYGTVIESLSLLPQSIIDEGQGWRDCEFKIYEVEGGRSRQVGAGYLER